MTTPRLGLETVPSSSLQPSVPVNDTLQVLDVLVQGHALEAERNAPPATTDANAGNAYIVGNAPTGLWLGKSGHLALCTAADSWRFITPFSGMSVFVQADGRVWRYTGSGWGADERAVTKTATHQLTEADPELVIMDVATANTLTVPNDVTETFAEGRRQFVYQKGAGSTSIVAGTGVTLIGSLTIGGQDKAAMLQKIAADTWVVIQLGGGSSAETKGADIASAATTDLGAATGQFVHVTGTTTITALGTATAGTRRVVRFADALTLTHNATSLILPGGSNITTATNDVATFISEGSGNWRLVTYLPASGATITAVAGPASATSDNIALFDGTTGKLIKDSTRTIASLRAPSVQTVTSAATVTPTFSDDLVRITAQAQALALANPTGTAIPGLGMVIRIKDNGTARAISYGTQYRAIGITLPTTTVANKTTYLAMIWNDTDTKWDVIATGTEA